MSDNNEKSINIYLFNKEDLYFRPYSKADAVWGAHGPVMTYRADKLNSNRFVKILEASMSFSKSGITDRELDEIYGSDVLPSKGKSTFTKKCHSVGIRSIDGIYEFSSTKRDGKGGFDYGYDMFTVLQNAFEEEIYEAFNKAMGVSIELG